MLSAALKWGAYPEISAYAEHKNPGKVLDAILNE